VRCSRPNLLATIALAALAASGVLGDARSPGGDPPFGLAFWEAMPGPMPLPVFDAVATESRGQVIVMGGCTSELAATRAVQVRHPMHGWLPIGCSLLEPRAKPTLTPLVSGRVLVLGGWDGRWGEAVRHHADGETLDPLVAGSGRRIEAWAEPLEGHTATVLPDGTVAVVCGCELRLFDPYTERWSDAQLLERERHGHAAILVGWTLVLAGGDEEGTIESLDLAAWPPQPTLWTPRLDGAPRDLAGIAIDGSSALLAGGFRQSDQSTCDQTYVLDLQRQSIRPGPDLGLERGACSLTLAKHPRGILVLDGEWRSEGRRGNADASLLLRPLASVGERDRWALPKLGPRLDLARRTLLVRRDGSVEALGGYRFIAPGEAREGAEAGVGVDGSDQRLVVDAAGVAD
jgi:hypothetical protein